MRSAAPEMEETRVHRRRVSGGARGIKFVVYSDWRPCANMADGGMWRRETISLRWREHRIAKTLVEWEIEKVIFFNNLGHRGSAMIHF